MYIHLRQKMCKELESLEEKYRNGAEMSEGDLRRIEMLTHAMKSLATYVAMKEAEDYRTEQNYNEQRSYNSYNNGYGNSYESNARMNNSYMNSYGPREEINRNMNMPYRPEERRW